MALPPDPDEPTRPLPPVDPARPVREREVVVEDVEPAWVREVLDRLRSLRTALAFVGVLAAAALGVALWALLSQEEEGDARRGASIDRVSRLEDRVDELERDTDRAPSRDAVRELGDRQEQLDERLSAFERQAGDDSAVEDLRRDVADLGTSVEEMTQTVQDLEQRVDELERAQADDGASP